MDVKEMASRGGKARAQALSVEERRKIAKKAAKASVKVRQQKAKLKRMMES